MERRALGASGVEAAVITFGAMAFLPDGEHESAGKRDAQRVAVIRAAIEAGSDSIDTAPLYGFGHSERLIGRAIRDLAGKPRVFTKVGLRWDDSHGEPLFETIDEQGKPRVVRRDSRPQSVLLEIERSRERLGVETIDLVQVHHRDRQVPIGETMGALRDAVLAGKARAIGVSNYLPGEIEEAQRALGDVPLANLQAPYSLLERQIEGRELEVVRRLGVGLVVYSPLAQGALSGRFGPGSAALKDWRRGGVFFTPNNQPAIAAALERVVAPIAQRHGATLAQVSLAWLIAQPGLSAVIVGASQEAQARENAGAAALRLTASELRELGETFANLPIDRRPYTSLRERVVGKAKRVVKRLIGRR